MIPRRRSLGTAGSHACEVICVEKVVNTAFSVAFSDDQEHHS